MVAGLEWRVARAPARREETTNDARAKGRTGTGLKRFVMLFGKPVNRSALGWQAIARVILACGF
jgi:hypothetical protein